MALESPHKSSLALWGAGLVERQARRPMGINQGLTVFFILALMLFYSCGYVSDLPPEPSRAPEIKSAGVTDQATAKDGQIQTLGIYKATPGSQPCG